MSIIKKIIPVSIKNKIKEFYYIGNTYKCNFCNRSFRKLLPTGTNEPVLIEKKIVGGGYRESVCPKCRSTDRERLLLIYLKDFLKIFDNKKSIKLLHIAPEKRLSKVLSKLPNIEYICGDKFTEGYIYPTNTINMDITSISFKKNEFDLIICNHVLEHIPDDKLAMSELFRVLKPGGVSIMQVPISLILNKTYEDWNVTSNEDRQRVFGQEDHVRIYGQDYITRLRDVGFKAEMINIYKTEPSYIKYGINCDEAIYLGKKE